MKSILVTGGAGYIGSQICKSLARANYQPVVLDNLSSGHRWAVQWGPLVEGDIANRALVRRTIETSGIEAVIHCAANAIVGESMENPYKYLHDNTAGSLALLEAMRESGVRHIVFSSSCATYGEPTAIPISEEHPQLPVNPYGESKLFVERALCWYGRIHRFSWVALRYFNVAGADSEGDIGECHSPETHLIPLVIAATLGVGPPVRVMGRDYPTHDGTAIRDYVHVEDLADAHIKSVEYLLSGGVSRPFNLGIGRGYSVSDVIAAVELMSGRQVPRTFVARRAGDPPVLIANTTDAETILSCRPRYSNLEAIVRTAWDWHRSAVGAKVTSQC